MKLPPSLKLRRTGNNFFKLIIAVGVSELAGVIGSFFTVSAIPNWYSTLVKPALSPPSWVFGPAWTTLYALMGIAAFLVWKYGWERKDVKTALGIFGIQLFLNAIWSIIFFGLQSPGWALVEIALLWFAIVWTIAVFYKISKPAAYLLVPYLLWVSFATYLNYAIWTLN
jgi:translocator protein